MPRLSPWTTTGNKCTRTCLKYKGMTLETKSSRLRTMKARPWGCHEHMCAYPSPSARQSMRWSWEGKWTGTEAGAVALPLPPSALLSDLDGILPLPLPPADDLALASSTKGSSDRSLYRTLLGTSSSPLFAPLDPFLDEGIRGFSFGQKG